MRKTNDVQFQAAEDRLWLLCLVLQTFLPQSPPWTFLCFSLASIMELGSSDAGECSGTWGGGCLCLSGSGTRIQSASTSSMISTGAQFCNCLLNFPFAAASKAVVLWTLWNQRGKADLNFVQVSGLGFLPRIFRTNKNVKLCSLQNVFRTSSKYKIIKKIYK